MKMCPLEPLGPNVWYFAHMMVLYQVCSNPTLGLQLVQPWWLLLLQICIWWKLIKKEGQGVYIYYVATYDCPLPSLLKSSPGFKIVLSLVITCYPHKLIDLVKILKFSRTIKLNESKYIMYLESDSVSV